MRHLFQLALAAYGVLVARAAPAQDDGYDYIVVGSGPGGGPLAADLARAGFKTLLLEAGDDQGTNQVYSEIANFIAASNDPTTRWDFYVKHSDSAEQDAKFTHTMWMQTNGSYYVGLDPPEGAKRLGIWYPRAATLGGCAMHNAGVTSLPLDDQWDEIAAMTKDDSWKASNMRKYLKLVENSTYAAADDTTHSKNGWMSIIKDDALWANMEFPATKFAEHLAASFGQDPKDVVKLLGQDIMTEGQDHESSLYAMSFHSTERGHRSSPRNYIVATQNDPAKYPLTVQLNTLVTKVLFDTSGKVPAATGVEVMRGAALYKADPKYDASKKAPKTEKIMAKREVIISGGTFNSPQILKLSGIGPAKELKKFDIPVIADLKGVGERLGDNYEASLVGVGKVPSGGTRVTSLFKTDNEPSKNRNVYAWCGAFSFEGFWVGYPDDHGPNQFECAIAHMNPQSQAGSVTLTSADPLDPPDINFRFFKNKGDEDLAELVSAIGQLREAWLKDNDESQPWEELHPCPGVGKTCTVEEQAEYIKTQAYSHHATSTCAIGADDDPMAVLDSKFRVRGVKGLRVVDASSWPMVPGAFPVLPTAMISTKAAEDIIAEAKKA